MFFNITKINWTSSKLISVLWHVPIKAGVLLEHWYQQRKNECNVGIPWDIKLLPTIQKAVLSDPDEMHVVLHIMVQKPPCYSLHYVKDIRILSTKTCYRNMIDWNSDIMNEINLWKWKWWHCVTIQQNLTPLNDSIVAVSEANSSWMSIKMWDWEMDVGRVPVIMVA